MNTDVLIAGSGIAGLSLAVKLNELDPDLHIHIVTKAAATECNTRYAQGGIAAVMNKIADSFENHITDTLKCGKGLCDKNIVAMVVQQAPERIRALEALGAHFDENENHILDLGLEGGHSANRIVHHKDQTGFEIESILIQQLKGRTNITISDNIYLADLIFSKDTGCSGAIVFNTANREIKVLNASVTVLASGGCGQVYLNTTNPVVATGDGYAIAERAGAEIKNMRFMQFHPTALYEPNSSAVQFLISEALRGFGAHIIDGNGKRFLFDHDPRGEMATRDIVSAAIQHQMKSQQTKFVFMDLRHLDQADCESHFPQITNHLRLRGYNIHTDLIPVVPSAHYQCGGVAIDANAQTSLKNLYAIGEVAYTGLHGANRLASNSLLEALVFSNQAAINIHRSVSHRTWNNLGVPETITVAKTPALPHETIVTLTAKVKEMMSDTAFEPNAKHWKEVAFRLMGISELTENELQEKHYSVALLNLCNMATTAQLIVNDKLLHEKEQLQFITQAEEIYL